MSNTENIEYRLDQVEKHTEKVDNKLENHEDECHKRHNKINSRLTRIETLLYVFGAIALFISPAIPYVIKFLTGE